MSEATGDKNASGDTVTVTEAAEKLGVTLPRLQRLLKRPEFTAYVSKGERQTKTGTRTVTLVSVSVLDALRSVIEEHKHEQSQPKALAFSDEQMRAYVGLLVAEKDARLQEQAEQITDLRRDKEELRGERERLQSRLLALESEVQQLRALPPPTADEQQQTTDAAPQAGRRWWWPFRKAEG